MTSRSRRSRGESKGTTNLVRTLEQQSRPRYWSARARSERRAAQRSHVRTSIRDAVGEKSADVRLLPALAWQAALALLGSAVVLLVTESVATWLRRFDTGLLERLAAQASSGSYESLVAAIIGVEGFLLAMFYATMGIVVSTSYQQVPAEIRQLFVRERSSQLFTRSVVRTLLLAILILGVAQLGHEPSALALTVLVVLAAFTVVTLVAVGTRLFNFFDLTSLSTQLPRRFSRASRAALSTSSKPDETTQLAAHDEAARVLRLYRQLTKLLATSNTTEVAGPRRLLSRALHTWDGYSRVKSSIPTDSRWFRRVPEHRDWLTMDHTRLSLALSTRTSIQPELVPDRLWVEKEVAQVVEDLLPTLWSEHEWEAAVDATDELISLTGALAERWQIEEALLVHRVVARSLLSAPAGVSPTATKAGALSELSELASTERSVFTLVAVLLGFVRPLQDFSAGRLLPLWEAAVQKPAGPYTVSAPHHVLSVLERLAAGIEIEVRAEGRRVSPGWWVAHHGAKAMSTTIVENTDQILDEVASAVVEPLESTSTDQNADTAAVSVFAALELASKLKAHIPLVDDALQQLAKSRRTEASDDHWPGARNWLEQIEQMERRIVEHLATVSVRLAPELDRGRPDLFGHAYRTIFEECFRSIVDGQTDVAERLLPPVFFASERARARLSSALDDESWRNQFVLASEPVIDLMELSGCAILMQELDETGVWDQMRGTWDGILSEPSSTGLPVLLAGTLAAREGVFEMTSGDIERTRRKQNLDRVLESRGIVDTHMLDPFETEPRIPHRSAIVSAFAPSDMGSFAELADLFVVHYLIARPGGDDLQLSARAQSLRERLAP